MLGQIEASKSIAKISPILLLDEVFVHLDNVRKSSLAEYIINSNLQTFITDTQLANLENFTNNSQTIHI